MNPPASGIAQLTDRIEQAITKELQSCVHETFWVTHYGANDLDPRCLVYWIVVISDVEKQRLERDSALLAALRGLLDQYEYPVEGRNGVHIGFESQETVDRESHGNFYHHWK